MAAPEDHHTDPECPRGDRSDDNNAANASGRDTGPGKRDGMKAIETAKAIELASDKMGDEV